MSFSALNLDQLTFLSKLRFTLSHSKYTRLLFRSLQSSTSMARNDQEHKKEEETAAAEEVTNFHTGKVYEDVILDLKAKLYEFDKDGNQWKERGAGSVKLLKHEQTGKVRLMFQSETLKICANHLVLPTMSVREHAGNDRSCVWHAADFSDGKLKDELFCLKFGSVDNCKKLMETFREVAESQKGKEENKGASDAAGLLKKLSLGGKKGKEEVKDDYDAPKEEAPEEAANTLGVAFCMKAKSWSVSFKFDGSF